MFPNSHPRLPHIRTTCSFSVMFLLMYNLSGNAIGFSLNAMAASGIYDPSSGEVPPRGTTIAIAISTLTFVVLMHMISRKGGIVVNNAFALFKVGLLLAIICMGIARAAGALGGHEEKIPQNFTKDVFVTEQKGPVSWSSSLLLCMYTFSGYEQPFYVLAETKSPRKYFPRYTVLAMVIAAVLFLAVNVSYLLAVDKSVILNTNKMDGDLATLFCGTLFAKNEEQAKRAMAAL